MLLNRRTDLFVNNTMPTEREYDHIKETDKPHSRLKFLDKAEWGIAIFIGIGIVALAIFGLACIIF